MSLGARCYTISRSSVGGTCQSVHGIPESLNVSHMLNAIPWMSQRKK
jgi:hypothetical protein